jgi:hypothetical protein
VAKVHGTVRIDDERCLDEAVVLRMRVAPDRLPRIALLELFLESPDHLLDGGPLARRHLLDRQEWNVVRGARHCNGGHGAHSCRTGFTHDRG